MKKNAIILKPIMPLSELFKKFKEDKAIIQQAIREGREDELKSKYKFVKSV
jgi:hypothetical protein